MGALVQLVECNVFAVGSRLGRCGVALGRRAVWTWLKLEAITRMFREVIRAASGWTRARLCRPQRRRDASFLRAAWVLAS